MPRAYRRRRYFKKLEIDLMRRLAAEGKSQRYVAGLLDRDPATIGGAAIRYGIQFAASPGRPATADPEERLKRRAMHCRRRRRRKKGIILHTISRFDDPRVMISLDTFL